MKNLVLATLMLGGLLPATGCIISSDDDTSGVEFDVSFTCPPDADTITVTTTPVGGASFNDDFDCADGAGVVLVDPGDYDMFATPNGSIGDFASSDVVSVSGSDGDAIPVSFDSFPTDVGFIGFSWTVDGSPSCPAGAPQVTIDATFLADSSLVATQLPCSDGAGLSTGLDFGDYTVVFGLLDDTEAYLDKTDQADLTISFGDQLEDFGNIDFTSGL